MSIRGLKKMALLLTFWVALQGRCLKAQTTDPGPLTVTGTGTTGNVDIYGDTLSAGSIIGTSNSPGWAVVYIDGTNSTVVFDAARSGNTWKWQQNEAGFQEQMSLSNTNVLTLYSPGSSPTPEITLSPTGTSIFTGPVTFSGTNNLMSGQTLTGTNSVLTEGLANGLYGSLSTVNSLSNTVNSLSNSVSSLSNFYGFITVGGSSNPKPNGYQGGTMVLNSDVMGNGQRGSASGAYSFAEAASTASGAYSVAMGQASASGNYSTALGQSTASGNYSTAMGQSTANGQDATAMGYAATAQAFGELAVGQFNVGKNSAGGNANATSWQLTDPLFELGDGTSTNAADALVVYKNGNMTENGNLTVNGAMTVTGTNNFTNTANFYGQPGITVNAPSDGSTDGAAIRFFNSLVPGAAGHRWSLFQSDDVETGSNYGSNFVIKRYDDLGNFIDVPFYIERQNGYAQIGGSFPANPTHQLEVAGTTWLDGNLTVDGTNNIMSGQTLTGTNSILTEGLADNRYGSLSTVNSLSNTVSSLSNFYGFITVGQSSGNNGESGGTMVLNSDVYGNEQSGSATAGAAFAEAASSASGYYSVAMGQSSASGYASTALGQAHAGGYASTALGGGTTVIGSYYSTAMGQATAIGNWSTAMGGATADGDYSTAMGYGSIANGNNSTAMGQSTANGQDATAMGYAATAQAFGELAVGQYNVGKNFAGGNANATSWQATDPLFELGDGTSTNATSDALVVYKNGNVTAQGTITTTNAISAGSFNTTGTITAGGAITTSGAVSAGSLSTTGTLNAGGALEIGGTPVTSLATTTPGAGVVTAAAIATNTNGGFATLGSGGVLSVSHGGTGTSSPALVSGSNIAITGSWPGQTISVSGLGSAAFLSSSNFITTSGNNTFSGTNNVTGLFEVGGKTLSLAGNFSTTGNYTMALTATTNTAVTLPSSGTLLTTTGSGANLSALPTNTSLYPQLNQNTTGSAGSVALSGVTGLGSGVVAAAAIATNTSGGFATLGSGGDLSVALGGTGTSSPALVNGSNIAISGSWPDQTVSVSGLGSAAFLSSSNVVTTTGNNTLSGTNTFTGAVSAGAVTAASLVTTGTITAGGAISTTGAISAGNVTTGGTLIAGATITAPTFVTTTQSGDIPMYTGGE
jgi:hypothetical protein